MGNTASKLSIDRFVALRSDLELALTTALQEANLVATLDAAVRHMLFPGGKRIRPLIALIFSTDLGANPKNLLRAAASLELLHTSSLIHDDLPAMDDDVMRRGKPTCHVAFDEPTAILAGDVLVGMAFKNLAGSDVEAALSKEFIAELSATYIKLCNGQHLDIAAHSHDDLKRIHELKTGALFGSAFKFGALNAGADDCLLQLAFDLGLLVGLSFQIIDDLIDGKSDTKGRVTSSDSKNQKITFGETVSESQKNEILTQTKDRIEVAMRELCVAFGTPALELSGTRAIVEDIFAKA